MKITNHHGKRGENKIENHFTLIQEREHARKSKEKLMIALSLSVSEADDFLTTFLSIVKCIPGRRPLVSQKKL